MRLERVQETPLVGAGAGARPASSPPRGVRGRLAWLRDLLTDRPLPRKTVIVGSEAGGQALRRHVLGDVVDRGEVTVVDGHRLGSQLGERLDREHPDDVYFDLGVPVDEQRLALAGARLLMDGASVHLVIPLRGAPPVQVEVKRRGAHAVVSLHAVRDRAAARVARRLLDIVGAAVLLAVLAPLLAAVALLVRWTGGRPIIHVQQRVGRGGRLFPLYKFRSMVVDAEDRVRASAAAYERYVASNFKLPSDEDDRVTPLGRVLRRTSLDELPQLWNVLRGDMSLVGPRAVVPEEVAEYGSYANMLLRVKPGLTGLWQVTGRSWIGYPERARIDLQYVARRGLREDLRILLRTLPAVLQQRGAL